MDIMEIFGVSFVEAIEIQAMNLDTALWMIQFWITATFGLIVAFHFTGKELSTSVFVLMQTLYVAVSAVGLMTYIQSGNAILYWNGLIDAQSVMHKVITQAQNDTAAFWRTASVIGGGALISLGTLATLFYGIQMRRKLER